jgi:hypothetical protein
MQWIFRHCGCRSEFVYSLAMNFTPPFPGAQATDRELASAVRGSDPAAFRGSAGAEGESDGEAGMEPEGRE